MVSSRVRLLHLADLHIGMENYGRLEASTGVNSRVVDFLRCLDEAASYALQNDVDLVVFAGDAYKTRNPNVTYQREFARRIKLLADAGIPVLLLVGNHDQPTAARRASSLDIFGTLGVPNVIVADVEDIHRIVTRRGVPVQVATVPYPGRSHLLTHDGYRNLSLEALDGALRDLITENIHALAQRIHSIRQLEPELPAILVAHLSVSGAQLGSEQQVMVGSDVVILKSVLADPAFDYVALGHIHRHQDLNAGYHPPVVYSGSLERIDFSEEQERKGFVVADIAPGEAEYRFVPVQARPFVTIRVQAEKGDPMRRILAEIERIPVADAVVRVIIHIDEEHERLIDEREIRSRLQGAHYISTIRKEVTRRYRQRLGEQAPESLTPPQALRRYLEAKGTLPERIETLLNYAQGIFYQEE